MACLPLPLLTDNALGRQMKKMADVVSSDSVTRAFLQLTQGNTKKLTVVDKVTKRFLRVRSLSQLPLGRPFIFGEGHTIVRNAMDCVVLAGKVSVSIRPLPVEGPEMNAPTKATTTSRGHPTAADAAIDEGGPCPLKDRPRPCAAPAPEPPVALERMSSSQARRLPTPEPVCRRHSGYLTVTAREEEEAGEGTHPDSSTRRERRLAVSRRKRSARSEVQDGRRDVPPEVVDAVEALVWKVESSTRQVPWADALD